MNVAGNLVTAAILYMLGTAANLFPRSQPLAIFSVLVVLGAALHSTGVWLTENRPRRQWLYPVAAVVVIGGVQAYAFTSGLPLWAPLLPGIGAMLMVALSITRMSRRGRNR